MAKNTVATSTADTPPFKFEPLPLEAWEDTKKTLHLFCQIVGKIRLRAHPRLNHWWHVPLYVSSRGLTTRAVPYGGADFEIELDLIDHVLEVSKTTGETRSLPLDGLSVARFYEAVVRSLAELGIHIPILARPYEHESKIPFAEDDEHKSYDKEFVGRYWRTLVQIDSIFKTFSGRFVGKQTPVHLYWHSFDLAQTRFSGRRAPPMEGGTPSDREAYSHEVISFGFWPGDDKLREPAFYSYTYPEPDGLADEPLTPAGASWVGETGGLMALLKYQDLVTAADPEDILLGFCESAYQAGARRAGWPVSDLSHDPAR